MPYKDKEKQREYQKLWTRKLPKITKENNSQRVNERRNAKRGIIREHKRLTGCFMCGINNPVVLEYHHKDPKLKEYNINYFVAGNWSMKKIQSEVDKCEVVCANCHRIIHHEDKTLRR